MHANVLVLQVLRELTQKLQYTRRLAWQFMERARMGLGVVFFVFYATALTNMRKSHGIANDYFNSFGLPLLSAKYRTAVHTIDEHRL